MCLSIVQEQWSCVVWPPRHGLLRPAERYIEWWLAKAGGQVKGPGNSRFVSMQRNFAGGSRFAKRGMSLVVGRRWKRWRKDRRCWVTGWQLSYSLGHELPGARSLEGNGGGLGPGVGTKTADARALEFLETEQISSKSTSWGEPGIAKTKVGCHESCIEREAGARTRQRRRRRVGGRPSAASHGVYAKVDGGEETGDELVTIGRSDICRT